MSRIGTLGDIHGNVEALDRAAAAFHAVGIKTVLQVGDLGVFWPGAERTAELMEESLASRGITLIFCPGNHDDWGRLLRVPVEPEGYRRITEHIWMLHGTVIEHEGLRIAGLGCATSSDKHSRLRYESRTGLKTWWAEERVDRDLAANLGRMREVDVLITHEISDGLGDAHIPQRRGTSESYARQATIDRLIIRDLFEVLDPKLHATGHHHVRQSVLLDESWYHEAKVEMMGRDGDMTGLAAVWDSGTAEVTDLLVVDKTVAE